MTTQLTIPQHALQPVTVPAFSALTITVHSTLLTLAETARPATLQLLQDAARLGIDTTPAIQWIYTGASGDETNQFQVEVVLPVAQLTGTPPEGTTFKTFMPFRCMSFTYTGSWGDFGELYDRLFEQFHRDGYTNDRHIREVYTVVDMKTPQNCVTDIQIGLM